MQRNCPASCILRFVAFSSLLCGACFLWISPGRSQSPRIPQNGGSLQVPAAAQGGSQTSSGTLKLNVNLVQVRVVVRDQQGKPVGNLKQDDFLLFDNGKPQVISSFSVETPTSHTATVEPNGAVKSEAAGVSAPPASANVVQLPQRFVALYFDDVHLEESHAIDVKQAATKFLNSVAPTDRVAVFTSSGRLAQEFTSDHDKLVAAIQQIAPHPLSARTPSADCPPLTYYQAYQIAEGGDPSALRVGINDLPNCTLPPRSTTQQQSMVVSAARMVEAQGQQEQLIALRNLMAVVRRMSVLPGQRIIVMVSPGFFVAPTTHEQSDLIDRATTAGIVVNTLDARGLYTSSVYDAASREHVDQFSTEFRQTEEFIMQDVLASIADGTGGRFFHNRNDLDQGLVQLAAQPEVSYVLGFSPQNLKLDGKYHKLKVTLASKTNWTLQARRGYFAPNGAASPEQTAYAEIDQALTSQAELKELPFECETQVFKTEDKARLSVIARIDTKNLKFRHAEDRNDDNLKVVMALFDNNGNLVSSVERQVNLQLKDATLTALNKTGIRVKVDFDAKPGTFLVRIVVRESESDQLGATSKAVVIAD
jgi:VWFA-related protein